MSVPVTAPVTATVGPVHLRLFPYTTAQVAVDEIDARPWMWGAACRVKFRIGELTTSKWVRQRYTYTDPRGWPVPTRPGSSELETGRQAVIANLRVQLARHGFDPPPFEFALIVTDYLTTAEAS